MLEGHMEELPYAIAVACIVLFLMIPNYFRIRRQDRKAAALLEDALSSGRHEPPSIRPWVDTSVCIGSGSCVEACPEKNVLQVIDGTARIVAGANCVGHGACMASCPVKAIELVFGSEARGIAIPAVRPDFETNVPGIHIAGELGGMGLIANAVEQGTQAMGYLLGRLEKRPDVDAEVVIVGAGPAGIGAALVAKQRNVKAIVLEQNELGGAMRHYPRQKLVMTRPMNLVGYGKVKYASLHKEELVTLFSDVVQKTGLEISERERVDAVRRSPDGVFEVVTPKRTIRTTRVLLALGRRGTPRRIGCPGEEMEKVAYSLVDPELYQQQHILVVGGGDAALEAAVALSEQPGNRVSLSYRGGAVNRAKTENVERLNRATAEGRLTAIFNSTVKAIELDRVILDEGGTERILPNDFVFVFAGGELPTKLLASAGVKIRTHHGKRIVEAAPSPRD
jgi:thioredoxin reductase (NADPH)